MLELGHRLKRLRERLGWSQRELASRAGLGCSSVAQIEQGLRSQLRPSTFEKLGQALNVSPVYFTTDDPRRYMQVQVSEWVSDSGGRWPALRPFERWKWILQDLHQKWGDEWTTELVAERLGLSPEGLSAMLAGDWDMPPALHHALSELTGAPLSAVLNGGTSVTDSLVREYRGAILAAYRAGITPEQLEQAVSLLAAVKK